MVAYFRGTGCTPKKEIAFSKTLLLEEGCNDKNPSRTAR